jgi:8-oxo-dGTP pyrophosphatase MutT (NUDIX family)
MNDAKYAVGQAGAIACRVTNGQLHILVVSPKDESGVWIFPKGHVGRNESFRAAALRECREEAGVDGVVIAPVGNPLEFRSKDEYVWVQYFLIWMTDYVPTDERRQQCWLPIADAVSTLSHEDARKLLESERPRLERLVLRSIDPEGEFREYLLHEFDHLGESLLANEEEGEKRVTSFLTVAGAVGAVLGFVLNNVQLFGPGVGRALVGGSLLVLLSLGYVTFARVVSRNVASDRYKQSLNRIRALFFDGPADEKLGFAPFSPYTIKPRKPWRWQRINKGGWLETMALVEALLVGMLGAFVVPQGWRWRWRAIAGVTSAVIAWVALIRHANSRYKTEISE